MPVTGYIMLLQIVKLAKQAAYFILKTIDISIETPRGRIASSLLRFSLVSMVLRCISLPL